MNFASDNAAAIAPDILAAIARANEGAALAYGTGLVSSRAMMRVGLWLNPLGAVVLFVLLRIMCPLLGWAD